MPITREDFHKLPTDNAIQLASSHLKDYLIDHNSAYSCYELIEVCNNRYWLNTIEASLKYLVDEDEVEKRMYKGQWYYAKKYL